MSQKGGTIPTSIGRLWARGVIGAVTLALAVLACYGVLALTALLSLIGVRLALYEGAWAGAIIAFAAVTVLAVLPGFRRHRSAVPGLGAVAGGGLILYALLIDYRMPVELAGFVLLAGAVCADVLMRRRARRLRAGAAAHVPAG